MVLKLGTNSIWWFKFNVFYPNGGIHRVREGNYVGPDHGKVVDVGDNYVAIMEIVTDGTANGWVERPRTLAYGPLWRIGLFYEDNIN